MVAAARVGALRAAATNWHTPAVGRAFRQCRSMMEREAAATAHGTRVLRRWRAAALARAVDGWRASAAAAMATRMLLRSTVVAWLRRRLAVGFRTWRKAAARMVHSRLLVGDAMSSTSPMRRRPFPDACGVTRPRCRGIVKSAQKRFFSLLLLRRGGLVWRAACSESMNSETTVWFLAILHRTRGCCWRQRDIS